MAYQYPPQGAIGQPNTNQYPPQTQPQNQNTMPHTSSFPNQPSQNQFGQPTMASRPQPGFSAAPTPSSNFYNPMPQPGFPSQQSQQLQQPAMPQPGFPSQQLQQPAMPQPGFLSQQPTMHQPGFPSQQPQQPAMPQPGFPSQPQQPTMPQPGFPSQPSFPNTQSQPLIPNPGFPNQGHQVNSQFPPTSSNNAYPPKPPMPNPTFPTQNQPPHQPGQQPPNQSTHPAFPPAPSNQQTPGLPNQYSQGHQQMQRKQPAAMPSHIKPVHAKYMACCVNAMPNSASLRQRSNLAFGVVIRPLANPPSGSQPPPVINFGPAGVVRCKVCRAYINPYVQFLDGGSRWRCNLCGRHNDVAQKYYASLNHQGIRSDIDRRPELQHASVEIVAPDEYMVRPPMPPVYVFVIDVSVASAQSGMLKTLCQSVLEVLDKIPGGKRTQVGFITFDSTVHFYSLKASDSTPKMYVLPDLEDLYLPVPSDLLVNLNDSREQVKSLLELLPGMHEKTQDMECAVGPALEAAMKLMARIGGKMLLFSSGIPSIGMGRLTNRENPRLLGTDQEQKMLNPATDFYKRTAVKLTRFQISVELYSFAHQYTDIATLSALPKLTGGQTYYYPFFTSKNDGQKFGKDLQRTLTRTTGWEAVIRVRGSQGVVMSAFHGNFYLRGTDLLALPSVDCDKAFAIEFKNDDTVLNSSTVSIQSALLYTTSQGERRIRVHTVCLPVTSNMGDLFKFANVNAISNLIAKQAINVALNTSLNRAREAIQAKCTAIVRAYRTALSQSREQPSMTLLGTLPLMTLGMIKNIAFREGTNTRPDLRASVLASLATMGVVECETFVRPRMLPIHEMDGKIGLNSDGKSAIDLPAEVGLTADQVTSKGVFLIDNGFIFLIRVGRQTDPAVLQDLFNIQALDTKTPLTLRIPAADDTTSGAHRLSNILTYLRKVSCHFQNVRIVQEGDPAEMEFFSMLIEDRCMNSMSLAEFSNHIQRNAFM